MATGSPLLLVGATGVLGSEITAQLSRNGRSIRALVRETADPVKRSLLEALPQVEFVSGDLKEPASLAEACRGVETVVTTASATASRQSGDSLESVDDQGQQALLSAARSQGVRRFVYISFPPMIDSPLQRAKRRMEEAIVGSGLEYVVLQPTYFMDVWFSPALGWDPLHGRVQLFGDGKGRTSWISVSDVARFAVAACDPRARTNLTLELGGPEALSQLDVLGMFRDLGGLQIGVETTTEVVLRSMNEKASNSLEQTFAALMLTVVAGQPIDTARQQEFLPGKLESVREHVLRVLGKLA